MIDLPGWLKAIKLAEIKIPNATMDELQGRLEELQSYASQYAPILAKIDYLPVIILLANPQLLKRIPHGAILNLVRPNWDLTDVIGTHMNVSHQTLVFHKKQEIFIRHASSSGQAQVIEERLLDYLKKFQNHPTHKGVHVMEINLP